MVVMANKPRYAAIVLDEQSRRDAYDALGVSLPTDTLDRFQGWDTICHHLTLNMGGLKDMELAGDRVSLFITAVGYNETAVAFRVDKHSRAGKLSSNEIPHVTLLVDRKNGGKPVHSNNITNWTPVKFEIVLDGTIQEVM